jgi:hypothetical protein
MADQSDKLRKITESDLEKGKLNTARQTPKPEVRPASQKPPKKGLS